MFEIDLYLHIKLFVLFDIESSDRVDQLAITGFRFLSLSRYHVDMFQRRSRHA